MSCWGYIEEIEWNYRKINWRIWHVISKETASDALLQGDIWTIWFLMMVSMVSLSIARIPSVFRSQLLLLLLLLRFASTVAFDHRCSTIDGIWPRQWLLIAIILHHRIAAGAIVVTIAIIINYRHDFAIAICLTLVVAATAARRRWYHFHDRLTTTQVIVDVIVWLASCMLRCTMAFYRTDTFALIILLNATLIWATINWITWIYMILYKLQGAENEMEEKRKKNSNHFLICSSESANISIAVMWCGYEPMHEWQLSVPRPTASMYWNGLRSVSV